MDDAWILIRNSSQNISQLEFRRSVVTIYLQTFKNMPSGSGRPSISKFSNVSSGISDDVRLDGKSHVLPQNARKRCEHNV